MKFWILMMGMALLTLLLYALNPFGTASLDPRARIFGIITFQIPSSSMSPTLQRGDFILVKTFSYAWEEPEIKDIVTYKPPHQDIPHVARVIARPGDRISVINANAVVNGNYLDEPYISTEIDKCRAEDFYEVVLPEDHYFIAGDNRCNSFDSRHFGFVHRERFIGKVFYIWKSPENGREGSI